MEQLIDISDLSRILGVTTRTLRYYESIGLINHHTMSESNHRQYHPSQIKEIERIILFKNLGFSLKEVALILQANDKNQVDQLFNQKVVEFANMAELLQMRKDTLLAVSTIYREKGISYVDNYHLIKELMNMNVIFIKKYNQLDLSTQIEIIRELYETGSISHNLIKKMGIDDSKQVLEEIHLSLVKELLNKVDAAVEKDIMTTLMKDDPELFRRFEKIMFTIEDVVVLPELIVELWLNNCKDEDIAYVINGTTSYARNKIIDNLSDLRRELIRDLADENGLPTMDQLYLSSEKMINELKQLDRDGKIHIERLG